jgi:hypothetical protein
MALGRCWRDAGEGVDGTGGSGRIPALNDGLSLLLAL